MPRHSVRDPTGRRLIARGNLPLEAVVGRSFVKLNRPNGAEVDRYSPMTLTSTRLARRPSNSP